MIRISLFEGSQAWETDRVQSVWSGSFSELGEVVTKQPWSPSIFAEDEWFDGQGRGKSGSHRTNGCFVRTDLLVVDIDGGCAIEEARRIFAPYRCIIGTSRSHQKVKRKRSGAEIPACDRFRVILQLEREITSDAEFKATWFAVQKLCPAIDPACKDLARFYFPCTAIVAQWEGAALPIAPVSAPSEVAPPTVPLAPGQRHKPSARTLAFVAMGAQEGMWHGELVAACYDLKQQLWSEEDAKALLTKVTGALDDHDIGVIEDVWANRAPRHEPRVKRNDALIQRIKRCHMITNIADPAQVCFVNLETGRVYDIHQDVAKRELYGDEYKEFIKTRALMAEFTYNPRLQAPLTTDSDGVHVYNTYVPPVWKAANYYKGEPIQAEPVMPQIYEEFFAHLTAGHQESKDYLLDWLAFSLQDRNQTILTAIGEEGIGKGTLATIMKHMHGEQNYSDATDKVFKEKFNGKLEAKTLVNVDEIDLKTKESQDRIKAVVNEYIEIEKKGIDSKTVRNFASFYISSNSFDAIKLGAGDRRYSIIQLTDTKLVQTPLMVRLKSELLLPENVYRLARHLYQRRVTRDMLIPFRSKRFEEVKVAGLADWEIFILEDFVPRHAPGQPLLSEVQEAITNARLLKQAPGRRKFEELSKKYPQMFQVRRRDSDGARYLSIPNEPKGFV